MNQTYTEELLRLDFYKFKYLKHITKEQVSNTQLLHH